MRKRVIMAACAILLCTIAASAEQSIHGLQQLLQSGASVMWVGAHPDDEALSGAMLGLAGPTLGNPLYMLVLTHGDGGECLLPEGCHPDLATVRHAELEQVALLYGAQLEHLRFWNAPLPVKSFPAREEIARIWVGQGIGRPSELIARSIRSFKPEVLLTFSPDRGFSGHPEHQLASRFATEAVRLAADPSLDLDGLEPYRVPHVYYILNRYWPYRLLGIADPGPVSETFDLKQPCAHGYACAELMAEFTRPHRTQAGDMGSVRRFYRLMGGTAYLREVDPFSEIRDPFEPDPHARPKNHAVDKPQE